MNKPFGHYVLLDILGQGGMGTVYKARDLRLGRTVALKLLSNLIGDVERRLRLLREAQAASALEHPHIVRIYEIGNAEGCDYIAMEFVAGETLDRLIGPGGMPVNRAIQYLSQVADALAYAHRAGVIHLDLKPGNIMVSELGHTTLLDFGLAKLTGAAADAASTGHEAALELQPGTVMGTVAYMSPEQARGGDLDERSDVFSLGVILFELLTGVRPFRGSTAAATLYAVINQAPALPLDASNRIPPEVHEIVLKALEKDRTRRYSSVAEFRDDLQRQLAPATADFRDTPTIVLRGGPRRIGFRKLVLALGVVPGLAAGVWFLSTRTSPNDPDARTLTRPLTSLRGGEYEPSISPDGRMFAFVWAGEDDANYDIYVQVIDVGTPIRLTSNPAGEGSPVWAPDGRHIAFVRYSKKAGESGIYVAPAFGGGPERKIASLSPLPHIYDRHLDWSPDGSWLAAVDKPSAEEPFAIYLISLSGQTRRQLTTPSPASIGDTGPAFSPDGRSIAFRRTENSGTNDLYIIPVSGGEPRRLTADRTFTSGHAWSQDGREVIFTSQRGGGSRSLWRVNAGGGIPQLIPDIGQEAYHIAIARTGNRFAYSKYSSDTNVWETDLATGRKARILGSTRNERSAQYSPDGSRIAFRSDRSGADEIWVCNASGDQAVQLTSFKGPLTGTPRWSPDGQFIAFDSRPGGNADIYVISASGGAPRRLTAASAEDVVPSWSSDGRSVLFASNRSGDWQVWKIAFDTTSEIDAPVQVTKKGGFASFTMPDASAILYAKGRDVPGIWTVPATGGVERPLIKSLKAGYWGNWGVAETGIFFVVPGPHAATVDEFDFATGRISTILALEKEPPFADAGFAVSRNGKKVLYSQIDQSGSDIFLVEHFR